MRRVVVLAVLLGVMLGLNALKIDHAAARDPLTLAAIGFVVLAAFTVAEAGTSIKLPRVTGYIVAGVVLGPSVLNVLSRQVVVEMQVFNTLALGLIAMAAGLELHVKGLVRLWRTLAATIVVKILVGVVLVGGAFVAHEVWRSSAGLGTRQEIYAAALVLGTLSIGTSPAIVLAVVKESGAKGRLSELVLGAAVLKDLVVVVCLAIAVAVARTLLVPDATLDARVLVGVGRELGLSVAVGGVIGAALIAYLRFVRFEMLLFVAGLILVVAEVAKAWHLELLLVFIAAGFVVSNFSRFEHELMGAINLVSLPVFVVFFTIAGATIELGTMWRLLPLAAMLCLARVVTYFVASRAGGTLGGEGEVVRKNAYLAYLPQAGVTLGLVGVAATQLPTVGDALRSVGMAVVALNLLVGPIALRVGLRRSGEVEEEAENDLEAATAKGRQGSAEQLSLPADAAAELAKVRRGVELAFGESLQRGLVQLFESPRPTLADEPVEAGPKEGDESLVGRATALVRAAHDAALVAVRAAPSWCRVGVSRSGSAEGATDGGAQERGPGSRPRGARVRQRRVALGQVVRMSYEPRMAAVAAGLVASVAKREAQRLNDARRVAVGSISKEEAAKREEARAAGWREGAEGLVAEAVKHASRDVERRTIRAASKGLLVRGPRYSEVEPQTRSFLEQLEAAPMWEVGLTAAGAEVSLFTTVAAVGRSTQVRLEDGVLGPVRAAYEVALPVLTGLADDLERVSGLLGAAAQTPEMESAKGLVPRLGQRHDPKRIEQAYADLRSSLSTHELATDLRAMAALIPETLEVPRRPVHELAGPGEVELADVSARRAVTEIMVERLVPELERTTRLISSRVGAGAGVAREALVVVGDVDSSLSQEGSKGDVGALVAAVQQSVTALREVVESLEVLRGELEEACRVAPASLVAVVEEASTTRSMDGRVKATRRRIRRAREALRRLIEVAEERVRRVMPTWDRLNRSLEQASQVRAGVEDYLSAGSETAYHRHFGEKPLNERRLFVIRKQALEQLLGAEAQWLEGRGGSVMVFGEHGSGKTSLLNLAQLDLRAPSVLRIRSPAAGKASKSLVDELAFELGCQPSRRAVERSLRSRKRAILIDDVERWCGADLSGLEALDELIDIMVRTERTTFWVAAIERSAAELWHEALALKQVFASLVHLGPLSTEEVARVIETRHRGSGLELIVPEYAISRIARWVSRRSEHDMIYGLLRGASRGNLRDALSAWSKVTKETESGGVEVDLQRLVDLGLGWNVSLGPADVAMLGVLCRFGPTIEKDLTGHLCMPVGELRRRVSFLRSAGLVEQPHTAGVVSVPSELRGKVVQLLMKRRAWPTGGEA